MVLVVACTSVSVRGTGLRHRCFVFVIFTGVVLDTREVVRTRRVCVQASSFRVIVTVTGYRFVTGMPCSVVVMLAVAATGVGR